MTTTTQLKKIINNTNEKVLSEKLSSYFINRLEDFNELLYTINRIKGNYQDSILYDNDFENIINVYNIPAEESLAAHFDDNYNSSDSYMYENGNGLYDSCNCMEDFFSENDIKILVVRISHQLKNEPIRTLKEFDNDLESELLQALK